MMMQSRISTAMSIYPARVGMNSIDRAENIHTVVSSERVTVTVSDTNFNP